MKNQKKSAQAQPKKIYLRLKRHLNTVDLFYRSDTAVGLPAATGFAEYEVYDAIDDVRAALAPPPAPRPQKPKPEPKTCGPILTPDEWGDLKGDAALIEKCKNEPPISEVCKPLWLTQPPEFFLGELFGDDDLLKATFPGHGPVVRPLGVLRKEIAAYSHVCPNALRVSAEPPRRFVVIRFNASCGDLNSKWKRVSLLAQKAKLIMLVHDSYTNSLEAWLNTSGWSAKKTADMARQSVRLGSEVRASSAGWSARIPNSACHKPANGAYAQLHAAGFLRDESQYKMRNFCLYWSPRGESK